MPFDDTNFETEVECLTTKPANVRKLIAWLREGRGPGFDMLSIFSEGSHEIPGRVTTQDWCGTTACICGHAVILAYMDGGYTDYLNEEWRGAVPYLGINDNDAFTLFELWKDPCSIPEAITKLEALLEPV